MKASSWTPAQESSIQVASHRPKTGTAQRYALSIKVIPFHSLRKRWALSDTWQPCLIRRRGRRRDLCWRPRGRVERSKDGSDKGDEGGFPDNEGAQGTMNEVP